MTDNNLQIALSALDNLEDIVDNFQKMVNLRDDYKSKYGVSFSRELFSQIYSTHNSEAVLVNYAISLYEDGRSDEALALLDRFIHASGDAVFLNTEWGHILSVYYFWSLAQARQADALDFVIERIIQSVTYAELLINSVLEIFSKELFIKSLNEFISSKAGLRDVKKLEAVTDYLGGVMPSIPKKLNYIPEMSSFSEARVAVIGNCQSSALKSIFRRIEGVRVVLSADINLEGSQDYSDACHKIINEDHLDFCLSQPLSDNFAGLSSANLSSKYGSRFFKFTNIYFSGFHPDLIYYGARGLRVQSAMGDYNSKIGLICYLKGISPSEAVGHFNFDNFRRLSYFDSYENSKAELLKRDEENEIRFAAEFFEISRNLLTLYTSNHPTLNAMVPLAYRICESIGVKSKEYDPVYFYNNLVRSHVWPIYTEVAESLGLNFQGSYLFFSSYDDNLAPMSLESFLEISYAKYDALGRDVISGIPGSDHLLNFDLN